MKRNSFKELGEKLRKLMDSVPKMREQIIAGIEQNISDAADVAVLAARHSSPHPNDGKRRGFNVITGELAAHWSWPQEYETPVCHLTFCKPILP